MCGSRPGAPPSTRRAALATAETLGDEATLATAIAGAALADFFRGGPLDLDQLEQAVELERRTGRSTSVYEDRPVMMLAHLLRRVGEYHRRGRSASKLLGEAVAVAMNATGPGPGIACRTSN